VVRILFLTLLYLKREKIFYLCLFKDIFLQVKIKKTSRRKRQKMTTQTQYSPISLKEESSLTAPEDRDKVNRWRPDQTSPALTKEEGTTAFESLNKPEFLSKFPKVDRVYADPPVHLQNFFLVSFVPAKGAIANEKGVYGFAKIRGSYATEIEANQRSEFLIRNVDSYHEIYHGYVGRPFPLTNSSNFSAEVSEVDIKKEMVESISSNIKKKKQEDEKEIRDIKEREAKLFEESEKAKKGEEVDSKSFDFYTTLKVKKAQLTWTYLEHEKKMREIERILVKTRRELFELDNEFPDYALGYLEKYRKARKDAGLKETAEELENSFMKYIVEDFNIPVVDKMYEEKYASASVTPREAQLSSEAGAGSAETVLPSSDNNLSIPQDLQK
jgi:hypothetical protein